MCSYISLLKWYIFSFLFSRSSVNGSAMWCTAKGSIGKQCQVTKWYGLLRYSQCSKAKAKMNSNIENILLSPALVFQAGTIDLQLLDRKERKAEILKRVPHVSEGDAEGAAYCYLIVLHYNITRWEFQGSLNQHLVIHDWFFYKWGWWWRGNDVQLDQGIHGMFSRFLSMSALCHIIELYADSIKQNAKLSPPYLNSNFKCETIVKKKEI